MRTEGISLVVESDAVREMARVATVANKEMENIGARRLHTIVERVMESLSFEAPDLPPGETVVGGAVTPPLPPSKSPWFNRLLAFSLTDHNERAGTRKGIVVAQVQRPIEVHFVSPERRSRGSFEQLRRSSAASRALGLDGGGGGGG